MRLYWIRAALNPITNVLRREEKGRRNRAGGQVKTEAEIGVMLPQARSHQSWKRQGRTFL